MTEIGEIFYRKDGNTWVAYDRSGNSARGINKQHAKNNYLLAFGDLCDQIRVGLDTSGIERKL